VTRGEAAALLGVAVDAPPAEIRRAFRNKAWSAHPDHGAANGSGLDRLTDAKDVLLAPTAEPVSAESVSGGPSQTSPKPPAASSVRAVAQDARRSRSPAGLVILIGVTVVLSVIAILIVLFVIAVLVGDEGDGIPTGGEECVFVLDSAQVGFGACTEPQAQRIDSSFTGAGECPAGTNTLVVDTTTWCLRPVR